MKTKLRLTLDVEYESYEDTKHLVDNLSNLVFRAVGEGLLTGSLDAEVEDYTYEVEELK